MGYTTEFEKEILDEEIKNKYLIFNLENNSYGIDIKNVVEIINIQKVTKIPDVPDYIKGIISLRGKIIPVLDMRLRFGMEEIAYNDRTCIIIIDWGAFSVGLIVDGVSDVMTFEEGDIIDPPDYNSNENKYIEYIGKVGNELKLILNCEKLLLDEDKIKLIK